MSSCSSSDGPPRPIVVKKFENIFFIIDLSFCMSVRILAISSSGSSEDEDDGSTSLCVRLDGDATVDLGGRVMEVVEGERLGEEARPFLRLFLFSVKASSRVFHFSKVLSIIFMASWI